MQTAFRKLSRVRSLAGGTTWYLSEDCLLAAKRVMYAVEYRRFYLRDLVSIAIWPSQSIWLLRLILPAVMFGGFAAIFWGMGLVTTGEVLGGVALAWLALELALGPMAKARITTTGAIVDLPLVMRTRRAQKVLDKIDVAVRTARGSAQQPVERMDGLNQVQPSVEAGLGVPATGAMTATTETNAS